MKRFVLLAASMVAAFSLSAQYRPRPRPLAAAANTPTEGSLYRLNDRGEPVDVCPLKHTDVKARISGFLARVNVTQEFVNSGPDKIEAVYKFPLPPAFNGGRYADAGGRSNGNRQDQSEGRSAGDL